MLTKDQIFSDLKQIMSKLLKKTLKEVEEMVKFESNLRDDLGIDSVESLDFVYALEDFYTIKIGDKEVIKLERVSDVINLIFAKKQGIQNQP